ncbi:MAG: hypothetical protein EPO32_03930 [Anaerolineae bacterium]|nr:MAG: hypothetical protein EPO32_03930 [Anaerolineae bacterium]
MRKAIHFLVLLLVLGLAACSVPPAADESPTPDFSAGGISGPAVATCTAISQAAARPDNPLTEAQPGDWSIGPEDAYATIIEYADFQCPYCASLAPILAQLQQEHPEDVRFVYRHFPLIGTPEEPLNPKAALAMQAAEAAGRQGMFWEMHDVLYGRYTQWATQEAALTEEAFLLWLGDSAAELGLDRAQFEADLTSPELAAEAQAAWDQGVALGLPNSPFVVINGQSLNLGEQMDILLEQNFGNTQSGFTSVQVSAFFYIILDYTLELTLLEPRQFQECPPLVADPAGTYIATIQTEQGDIVIRLFPDVAPFTVSSFIFLADRGWFDDITFHRVLPGFVAQAGDPSGTGAGSPGYYFGLEADPNLLFDRPGLVAMAHQANAPDTNGSQFFITTAPAENLNGDYTIFGEVIEGMDIVLNLTPRDPSANPGAPPGDTILTITVAGP